MKNFNAGIGLEIFVLLVVGLVLSSLFLDGCTLKESNNENQVVIAKITSRHIGDALVKNYPDIAITVEEICHEIINQEKPELISSVIKALSDDRIDDSLLRADIQDIVSLLDVQTEKNQITQAVAEGLLSGILQGWSQL